MRTVIAALLLVWPVAAHAGPMKSPEKIATHIFKSADTNGDGEMTRAEHDAARLERYGSKFEMFDINKNDRVTYQEYLTVFLKFHSGSTGKEA